MAIVLTTINTNSNQRNEMGITVVEKLLVIGSLGSQVTMPCTMFSFVQFTRQIQENLPEVSTILNCNAVKKTNKNTNT